MNAGIRQLVAGREVQVLVCESGQRWFHVARRFVGVGAPGGSSIWSASPGSLQDLHFHVRSVDHSKVRSLIGGLPEFVLLWELSRDNADAIALTLAQIGVARPDALQLAAIDGPSCRHRRHLALLALQLGVDGVIEAPEQMAAMTRMIHRRYASEVADR